MQNCTKIGFLGVWVHPGRPYGVKGGREGDVDTILSGFGEAFGYLLATCFTPVCSLLRLFWKHIFCMVSWGRFRRLWVTFGCHLGTNLTFFGDRWVQ